MKIKLFALGKKMPSWVHQAFEEYRKRLTFSSIQLELIELPIFKRTKKNSVKICLIKESKMILSKLKKYDYLVILDEQSKLVTTEELAHKISKWQKSLNNVVILIGGPDGLGESIKSIAKEKISLSKMTFPHPIVRIILAEQIYRSSTIINGHPYHRS